MKTIKTPYFFISSIFAIFIFLTLFFFNYINHFNYEFELRPPIIGNNLIDLASIVETNRNGTRFIPVKVYLSSDNWKNPNILSNDINSLNSRFPDSLENMNLIVNALTIDAFEFKCDDLDSLYNLLNWAESFKIEADKNNQNVIAFSAISDFWMGFIANKLYDLFERNNEIKYSFKYRFLKTRLSNFNYFIGQGFSNIEKIFLYALDNKWSYIADRVWNGTSLPFKFIIFIFIAFTTYSYLHLFRRALKK